MTTGVKKEKELEELREARLQLKPDPVIAESSRIIVRNLVETAIVGRTAEALRRRETGRLLLGVASSDRIYRTTTYANRETCRCHIISQAALSAGNGLPETAGDAPLKQQVTEVVKSITVGQPVEIDEYLVGNYSFEDVEDRELVDKAIAAGKDDPATYRILTSGLCLNPRQTAERRTQEAWPFFRSSPDASGSALLAIQAGPPDEVATSGLPVVVPETGRKDRGE